MEVEHKYSESIEGIEAFMGSKYVQSSVGDSFQKVLYFLQHGRMVLFSGTPCEVQGLKAFLRKDYENLITLDFICHGVPSRLVWRKYLNWKSGNRKVKAVNFRDKTDGWLKFSLKIDFMDGSSYCQNPDLDIYMRGFLQDLYLRPSCYECSFKGVARNTDITLADLWGCREIMPELYDDRGTSLVFIQSDKGVKIWDVIIDQVRCKVLEDERYKQYNPNMLISVNCNPKRKKFYRSCSMRNMEKLTRPAGPLRKMVRKGKRMVRKIVRK